MPDRRDPFGDLDELFERLNRQFTDFGRQFEGGMGGMGGVGALAGGMHVDLAESDDSIVVTADLPGFDRDDIEIRIDEQTLTISASSEETAEQTDEDLHYHKRERHHRTVSRRLRLPTDVEGDEASASYQNGVLTVTLPKVQADEGHHIDIQ
ncbi:Hsp20/alpha crystallin family protein [Haloferacaceae archaeon DSL9]